MKLCRIIPTNMKPVFHILPNNRTISVPTEIPLSASQIIRATAQATVYEVVERGEVLLTPQNRFSDNTNAPVATTNHEIKEYYNAQGQRIYPDKDAKSEAAVDVKVEEAVKEEEPKAEVAVDVKVEEVKTTVAEQQQDVEAAPAQKANNNSKNSNRNKNNRKN